MEMKPDVFLQLSREINECIDYFSGRPAMIGTCQAQIVHTFSLRQSPLRFPFLDFKFLTVHRPVILCRVGRYSCACQTGKSLFLCFHLFHCFSQIGSIVLAAPGDRNSIYEAVTLQSAVDDPDLFRFLLSFHYINKSLTGHTLQKKASVFKNS